EPPEVANVLPSGENAIDATGAGATRVGCPMLWPVFGFQRFTIPLQVPLASVPSGANARAVTLPLAFGTVIVRRSPPVRVFTMSTRTGWPGDVSADTAAVAPSGDRATASPNPCRFSGLPPTSLP